MRVHCTLLLAAVLSLVDRLSAFEITFPSSSEDYWVACKWNTLKWTSNSTDANIFSVALLNTNMTRLNGNYQIANSLPSIKGIANLTTNCVVPSDGYYLAFVNASHYSLNNPQVFFTSQTFTIKPNTTEPLNVTSRASSGSSSTISTAGAESNQAANPSSGETTDAKKINKSADGALRDASQLSVALCCLFAAASAASFVLV